LMDRGIRVTHNILSKAVPDYAEFHGDTGCTLGGVGYSPLLRTIHFTPLVGNIRYHKGTNVRAVAGQGR